MRRQYALSLYLSLILPPHLGRKGPLKLSNNNNDNIPFFKATPFSSFRLKSLLFFLFHYFQTISFYFKTNFLYIGAYIIFKEYIICKKKPSVSLSVGHYFVNQNSRLKYSYSCIKKKLFLHLSKTCFYSPMMS